MAEQSKQSYTFKDKTIDDLENLFDIENAEKKLENPREYTERIRNEYNWYRALLQYLEMYLEWQGKEIDGTPLLKLDWQSNKQFWSKDRFYRTRYWKEKRQEILQRDNEKCQNCGLTQNQQRKQGKTDRGLEVHHIKKRMSFPKDERETEGEAHKNSNLITLCTKCHGQLETRKPKRQREILDFHT